MEVMPMRRAIPALAVVTLLTCAVSTPAGWTKAKYLVVRGQVTDQEGKGVESAPVRILATRRVVRFLGIESRPAEKELVSTVTGPDGFYEVEVPKLRDYDYYFLRFYDSTHFDSIRYAKPPDIEITSWIRKRRPVVQDMQMRWAAGWDAVQRLVSLYGADSVRGQVVRQLGVPERIERATTEGVDRETWWYEGAGVAYIIENGQVVEKKSFQPTQESSPLARR